MGLYQYITHQDRISMKIVKDKYLQEAFDEALKYDNSLLISSHIHYEKKCFFSKWKEVIHYTIMHETHPKSETPYQARVQSSAMGDKSIIFAYLYGIINGANLSIKQHEA